ncbi:MAG: T9SS type A sorting domain-containing protein [Cyclobacteriaceae bacterium]|nr:T9SS type A sorting domain-containing protein [Cyclobacteriaceae bacterium]
METNKRFRQVFRVSTARLALMLILSIVGQRLNAQNVSNINGWYPNSTVQAIVEDNEFYYLGGNFTSLSDGISTVDIAYLARIRKSDNTPDETWDPQTDNIVKALALDGADLYVGGSFSTCGGATRNYLAKINTATAIADASFNPDPDAPVQAIVFSGSSVIVGGTFRNIDDTELSALAKLDKADGSLTGGWDTNINLSAAYSPGTNFGNVEVLAIDGDDLFVGGGFAEINDGGSITNRNSIAKLSATDGSVDATWNPDPGTNKLIHSMVVSGTSLFISGNFASIGGQTRRNLAKLSTTGTGAADAAWDPAVGPKNGFIFAMETDGTYLYTGGGFTTIGGQSIGRLARLSLTGAATADTEWLPSPGGSVNALKRSGENLIAGGNFTSMAGQSVERFAIIIPENMPPVLDAIGNKSVDEDMELAFTASATDVETPEALVFSIDETSVSKGMSIDETTGAFFWIPTQSDLGANSVTITVTDGDKSDSETIDINVAEVNDAPVLNPIGNKSVTQDVEMSFTATASDEETPGSLQFSLDATSTSKGMSIGQTTGLFVWTPAELEIGDHTVVISVSDGQSSDSESIVITVNSTNTAPVLTINSGLSVVQGASATLSDTNLLVSDAQQIGTEIVFSLTAIPSNGKLKKSGVDLAAGGTFTQADINDGKISYDHDGFNGATDKFVFTVTDGKGGEIAATDFNISIDIITALEDRELYDGLSIYPNPATSRATLQVTNSYRGPVAMKLMDVTGKELSKKEDSKFSDTMTVPLDLSESQQGLLILRVNMGGLVSTYRIVKK